MASEQMKIFTRTFDFLTWLLPATNHFPRAHRHTFTQRLLDAAFDFQERIEEANRNDNLGFRVCASTFFSGILAGTAGRLLASWPRRKMAEPGPGRDRAPLSGPLSFWERAGVREGERPGEYHQPCALGLRSLAQGQSF